MLRSPETCATAPVPSKVISHAALGRCSRWSPPLRNSNLN